MVKFQNTKEYDFKCNQEMANGFQITYLCKKCKLEKSGTISLQSQKRISGKLTLYQMH